MTAGAHCGSSGEMGFAMMSCNSFSSRSEFRQSCSAAESCLNRSPQTMATESAPDSGGVGVGTAIGLSGVGDGATTVVVGMRVGLGAGVGVVGAESRNHRRRRK